MLPDGYHSWSALSENNVGLQTYERTGIVLHSIVISLAQSDVQEQVLAPYPA